MSQSLFAEVDRHFSNLFQLEDAVLKATESSIRAHGMPEHSVSANQGQFLQLLARMCNVRLMVEVGTLGGYSTIWLARALPEDGKLISIELEPEFAAVAKRNLEAAGLQHKVEVHTGQAMDVLPTLELGESPVDLFFMDADKPNYVNYFRWALAYSRPGSLILADNVIRNGRVLDQHSADEKVRGVRAYAEMLATETRVHSSVLAQVGEKEYDGLAISLVK